MLDEWRPATPPRRRPLVEQVIASLRELIATECLRTGDKLPSETKLSERLGVGRSTLREAVQVLVHTGVLEARQGSGTYVGRPSERDELAERLAAARAPEVFEVRTALEVLVAQVAPLRRTDEHVAALREALGECRAHAEAGDVVAFIAADSRFHRITVEAADNSVLVEIYDVLRRSLEPALSVLVGVVELRQANDRHEVLLDAIESGDPAAAVAATRTHLADTIALFGGTVTPPPA
ncbi:FadR/GntR family transcriptional regulator [Umezawaea sp. Da 62-37]|uniref:FadR/GntR family transcriptional regulator n=1 Tax=Umezawaea sp. Da 62-37 TaxID=3075927 RepID=UPI0028F72BEC|nr:FadR/GntR family transcriptional regulator [Umezawaea sp. Da 62-37]WNV85567.1 FadR/GntR family transcriptional regulator [Umezawaea sp. Da 62-37]